MALDALNTYTHNWMGRVSVYTKGWTDRQADKWIGQSSNCMLMVPLLAFVCVSLLQHHSLA